MKTVKFVAFVVVLVAQALRAADACDM